MDVTISLTGSAGCWRRWKIRPTLTQAIAIARAVVAVAASGDGSPCPSLPADRGVSGAAGAGAAGRGVVPAGTASHRPPPSHHSAAPRRPSRPGVRARPRRPRRHYRNLRPTSQPRADELGTPPHRGQRTQRGRALGPRKLDRRLTGTAPAQNQLNGIGQRTGKAAGQRAHGHPADPEWLPTRRRSREDGATDIKSPGQNRHPERIRRKGQPDIEGIETMSVTIQLTRPPVAKASPTSRA